MGTFRVPSDDETDYTYYSENNCNNNNNSNNNNYNNNSYGSSHNNTNNSNDNENNNNNNSNNAIEVEVVGKRIPVFLEPGLTFGKLFTVSLKYIGVRPIDMENYEWAEQNLNFKQRLLLKIIIKVGVCLILYRRVYDRCIYYICVFVGNITVWSSRIK